MAVGIASLALGAIQLGKGIYDASQAQDPQQVQETAEMKAARARATEMANYGFTPQEKAAFRQSSAASGNTAYRRGVDMGGGNLAAALKSAINANNLNANNQFATQDAALHRQNIGMSNSLEQGYQGLKNTQVAQNNALAQQQNAAATQSINSGLGNLGSALNLTQALNYNPNPNGTNINTTQPQSFSNGVPTLTPSGQVAPVGLGNYQIGQNSNVSVPQNNMFQQQPNLGGFNGMRYDYLTGKWVY